MAPVTRFLILLTLCAVVSPGWAQSNPGQSGSQSNDIPDAPSTVQPPPPTKLPTPPPLTQPAPDASQTGAARTVPGNSSSQQPGQDSQIPQTAAPAMPPVQTVAPGSVPANQVNPQEQLYKLRVNVNFVQVPVMVKDTEGRLVDGLLYKDFTVLENGKKQTLTFFTSDPFPLAVAVLIDIGMPDVAVQKVNETYSALVGAFSPYDEVALYTYSSTVSQLSDFTHRPERLTTALNAMKTVRGGNNGPPVLGGPLESGPTVNGAPVGGPTIQPVNTPPREAHVLNDAILEAALDLNKRDRALRKVIFVISDGRELGSKASYRDVLKVLQTHEIQVKAVVLDSGALPGFKQAAKFHLPFQGYSDILPKYTKATGGGKPYTELTRISMEDAYAAITSDARNQYTLGYVPQAIASSSAYRSIEVRVHKANLKVDARDGYYPLGR